MSYDVAVVGGGPAGAATARWLAGAGRSVLVLERTDFDRPRVGETLAPAVQPLLRDLGIWERFTALQPLPSWGTRSIWAAAEPSSFSHLDSGHASGWHVDRCAVDRMLATAAAEAGAQLWTHTSVTSCRHDGTTWDVRCSDGRSVRARVLVDATGRRAAVGRWLGARRPVFDRLVAVAGEWDGVDVSREGYLLIEASEDGWWYTAPVPSGAVVAMLMTDTDLCRQGTLSSGARWRARLPHATADRVGGAQLRSAPQVHAAGSHRLVRAGDARPWIAVGDAALAVDPVSGSGTLRALRTARAAATTVAGLLDHPGRAASLIRDHEADRDTECTTYLIQRAAVYGSVRRYTSPFWARRAPRPTSEVPST